MAEPSHQARASVIRSSTWTLMARNGSGGLLWPMGAVVPSAMVGSSEGDFVVGEAEVIGGRLSGRGWFWLWRELRGEALHLSDHAGIRRAVHRLLPAGLVLPPGVSKGVAVDRAGLQVRKCSLL